MMRGNTVENVPMCGGEEYCGPCREHAISSGVEAWASLAVIEPAPVVFGDYAQHCTARFRRRTNVEALLRAGDQKLLRLPELLTLVMRYGSVIDVVASSADTYDHFRVYVSKYGLTLPETGREKKRRRRGVFAPYRERRKRLRCLCNQHGMLMRQLSFAYVYGYDVLELNDALRMCRPELDRISGERAKCTLEPVSLPTHIRVAA